AASNPGPPKRLLQTCLPEASSFATKKSKSPALASGPPPRSIVPLKRPVMNALSAASRTTMDELCISPSPARVAHAAGPAPQPPIPPIPEALLEAALLEVALLEAAMLEVALLEVALLEVTPMPPTPPVPVPLDEEDVAPPPEQALNSASE